MKSENINWARLRKALLQESTSAAYSERVDEVLKYMHEALGLCGEYSHSRKMVLRIASTILRCSETTIIAPVCPDYSHEQGKYTFHSLGGGVSLLTEKHIVFLKKIAMCFPKMKVTFLLADHEADDKDICRIVGRTNQEFLQLVGQSLIETKDHVSSYGWDVKLMTDAIPGLVKKEEHISRLIAGNPEYNGRIRREAEQRLEMYLKINRSFSDQDILQRTIHTAAQYVAMGEYAVEHDYILCNHTTTNLSWYLQTSAAVLHNPISIY